MKKSTLAAFVLLTTSLSVQAQTTTAPDKIVICDKVKNYDGSNFIYAVGDVLLAKPEFEYYFGISNDDQKYFDELSKIIKRDNIHILALPIPYKASIYINKTNNPAPIKYDPMKAKAFYDAQINNLSSHGFSVINLDNIARNMPTGINFFANHDHHWTGEAMDVVANKVAQLVDKTKLAIKRDAQTTLTKTTADYDGSVAGELNSQCGFKFAVPEKRVFYNLSVAGGDSLLGDTTNDVVIVGDSFGIPYFGFDKVLSDKLKTPITNFSINGGGFSASINGYFASLKPGDQKAKLIIWTALPIVTSSNELRELKPSIYQAYHNGNIVKRLMATQTNTVSNDLNLKLDKNNRYYLRVRIEGPKAEGLQIKFTYGDSGEDINLNRSNQSQKASYTTDYFYELKPGTTMLKSLSVAIPDKGNMIVEIYKYGNI